MAANHIRRYRRWIVILILIILFIPMTNWLIQKMVYPAPWFRVSEAPSPLEDVFIPFSGSEQAHGWLYREPSAADSTPVLLFFHGNGENLETMRMSGILEDFRRLKVHFLAMDYPGYGRSSGSASEPALTKSAYAAFDWIRESFPENPKIICGWSLGAAVAFQAAARYNEEIDGFIALSSWSSLPDVAAEHYPRWMVNTLLKERYNSLEAARQIHCPALIVHGEADSIIPVNQGEKVAANMGSPPRWIKVAQTGHNDLLARAIVWEEIRKFLSGLRI